MDKGHGWGIKDLITPANFVFLYGMKGKEEDALSIWLRGCEPSLMASFACLGLHQAAVSQGLQWTWHGSGEGVIFPCFQRDPMDPSLKAEGSKCLRSSMFTWWLVAVGLCSRRLLWPKPRNRQEPIHQLCPFTLSLSLPA